MRTDTEIEHSVLKPMRRGSHWFTGWMGIAPIATILIVRVARVRAEIEQVFDIYENVYFIVIDNSADKIGRGGRFAGGVGGRRGKNGGYALVPRRFAFETLTHELGHAFGLRHDFRDKAYIMAYGSARDRFSGCSTGFLVAHPYLDTNIALEEGPSPTIEIVSPQAYPVGSERVPVQLGLSDSGGLHQAILFARTIKPHSAAGSLEIKACRGLAGVQNDMVEFDYDGIIPSDGFTNLSDPPLHSMHTYVVDKNGDLGTMPVVLAEISPNHISTLGGHSEEVWSVSLSPRGLHPCFRVIGWYDQTMGRFSTSTYSHA